MIERQVIMQNTCCDILKFNKAYEEQDVFDEYLTFSVFFQNCFISEDGWIVDTGNFRTVNRILIQKVAEKIKKHPWIWKKFFMVA